MPRTASRVVVSMLTTLPMGFWPIFGMVISPPTTTTLLLANLSHATRLLTSTRRQASRMASEMVSQTLSGWPSPTDSEEKMKLRDMECGVMGLFGHEPQREMNALTNHDCVICHEAYRAVNGKFQIFFS